MPTKRDSKLMDAAWSGNTREVERLVKKGANVNSKSSLGVAALKFAAAEGHIAAVELLIELGARLDDKDSEGCTALMSAAREGHPEVVGSLLARGADPLATNDCGMTAMDIALAHCDRDDAGFRGGRAQTKHEMIAATLRSAVEARGKRALNYELQVGGGEESETLASSSSSSSSSSFALV